MLVGAGRQDPEVATAPTLLVGAGRQDPEVATAPMMLVGADRIRRLLQPPHCLWG